jgi:hypothetical protein
MRLPGHHKQTKHFPAVVLGGTTAATTASILHDSFTLQELCRRRKPLLRSSGVALALDWVSRLHLHQFPQGLEVL